jgi:hypothetical protein
MKPIDDLRREITARSTQPPDEDGAHE